MYNNVQTAVESYFQTNWVSTPIVFENHSVNSDLYDEFARLNIQFGDADNAALGGRFVRTAAVLFITIFVRPGIGTSRLLTLVETVYNLFRNTQISGTGYKISFRVPDVTKMPVENNWASAQVTCNFFVDESY